MDKKILITGATGFAGSHLVDLLLKSNDQIFGTFYSETSLSNLENKEKIKLLKTDLTKKDQVKLLIEKVKPDYLYHLAALTAPMSSFEDPSETFINNVISELNILEELRRNNLKKTKVLIASSAEVYGNVSKENLPISENVPLNPTNPYAVSKIAQDFLGRQYFLSYGLSIIRVRPFNHIGPKQSPNFVVSSFAKKIVDIEKGRKDPVLNVGNLNAKRDFTDVRDVVKAYRMILDKGELGEVYNIGSGKSYKISEILNMLLSFSKTKIEIKVDKSLLRPIDNPELVCDFKKICKITGWKPEIALQTTLYDTLDYWRSIN